MGRRSPRFGLNLSLSNTTPSASPQHMLFLKACVTVSWQEKVNLKSAHGAEAAWHWSPGGGCTVPGPCPAPGALDGPGYRRGRLGVSGGDGVLLARPRECGGAGGAAAGMELGCSGDGVGVQWGFSADTVGMN